MRSYLSLIPVSAKVRKRQNRMTILCIVISVFLVTVVFSMADMAIRMETNNRIRKDGNWHIMLNSINGNITMDLSGRSDIAAFSRYGNVNGTIDKDYLVDGKKAAICGADRDIMQILPGFDGGAYPSDGEVIVTENIKELLHVTVGDNIVLTMPNGESMSLEIVGFNQDTGVAKHYDAVVLFLNFDTFEKIRRENNETADTQYYVLFKKHTKMRNAISEIKEQYSLSEENVSENPFLLALSGSTDNSYMVGLYLVAAVLAVMVMLAGVFMIAGSINSNVLQRTGFYGMLRCLGAGKSQIMNLVRLEALSWCKTAIPVGTISGIVVTCGLCAFLRVFIGNEFRSLPVFEISPVGILSGIVIGFLTVWFAASSPAKKAAKVSPISAAAGNANPDCRFTSHRSVKKRKNIMFERKIDTFLGIYHATASKKNLILMMGSFALSIILFLCFSVLLGWINMALSPLKPYAPDLTVSETSGKSGLECGLVSELEENTVVKRAFGRMYQRLPADYQGKESSIDLISYDDCQFNWAKEDLVAGAVPEDKTDGKHYVLTVFDKSNSLAVGDTIQLDGAELTVSGVLDDSPFDSNGFPTVICPEKTFETLTGQKNYAIIDIQLTNQATDTDVNGIRAVLDAELGNNFIFSDRRELNREVESTYWAFHLFVYAFLAIIALITVLNIVNSISLSVSARMKQYGAMRAIGMDGAQITRMITAETLTYGIVGLIAGSIIGLPLYRYLYTMLITNYFGSVCRMPWICFAVILGIISVSVFFAVYAPAKRIRDMPVTATINEL